MKISQITLADVKSALRIDFTDDDSRLQTIMTTTKAVIREWTGLTESTMDDFEQLYYLYMSICQHMYDNGTLVMDKGNLDLMCRTILNQCMSPDVILA